MTNETSISLEDLVKDHSMLWRGSKKNISSDQFLKTGYAELDQFLPTGGWPSDSLTEIIVDHWGNGELQVLLPLLMKISQNAFPIVFIAPPHIPYAPALESAGILLDKLIIIDDEINTNDLWWVAEKTLRHPECGAVLIWPKNQNPQHIRRLQLAASTARNPGFLFRCGAPTQSPAPLRLKLSRSMDDITIRILKSRFGWQQNRSISLHLP
ncbi:MAG: translesion DNA synthesis-associated protein ImuA [Gammaproteobacteria bacterium]|nr:translesion DNA synthesis-associated protein ImuA [Gammaproteobacteria bacterium]